MPRCVQQAQRSVASPELSSGVLKDFLLDMSIDPHTTSSVYSACMNTCSRHAPWDSSNAIEPLADENELCFSPLVAAGWLRGGPF